MTLPGTPSIGASLSRPAWSKPAGASFDKLRGLRASQGVGKTRTAPTTGNLGGDVVIPDLVPSAKGGQPAGNLGGDVVIPDHGATTLLDARAAMKNEAVVRFMADRA